MSQSLKNKRSRLGPLLQQLSGQALIAPGIYDALSALLAVEAGFKCLYLSGASLSYTQFGQPDIGFTGLSDVEAVTMKISACVDVPLIVDADTAFGGPANAAYTISRLEAAGAAAIQIEDQMLPKKCGHLDGKSLIPREEMAVKISAAATSRKYDDTLLIARTDAIAVEGLEAAIERAEFYVEAGADILFIEAPTNIHDLQHIADKLSSRAPLLINMVDGGKTPLLSAERLAEIGYSIVIFPGGTARAVTKALKSYFETLHSTGDIQSLTEKLAGFSELNSILGLADYKNLEDRLLGEVSEKVKSKQTGLPYEKGET